MKKTMLALFMAASVITTLTVAYSFKAKDQQTFSFRDDAEEYLKAADVLADWMDNHPTDTTSTDFLTFWSNYWEKHEYLKNTYGNVDDEFRALEEGPIWPGYAIPCKLRCARAYYACMDQASSWGGVFSYPNPWDCAREYRNCLESLCGA